MQRILILGAGTAGTMMANRLVRVLSPAWRVTVVDRDDEHLYQPGLLFIPFGMYRDDELVRPRHRTLDPRVELRLAAIDRIAPDAREVRLVGGEAIPYDFLIIATGSRIVPEATPGLTAAGWRQSAFDFYTLDGADALRGALERFPGGRLVVNVVEMPIKCPVAPLEFLFLAEAFFTQRGMRDKVEVVYATPLEGAFTKPVASAHLGGMLARRGIGVVGDFATAEVDGTRRVLKAYDGREEPYDLLVTIPAHAGAATIAASGMGDGSGWVPTDKYTLAARNHDRVFVLGDATDLPSSKAGAVAHFQADVLIENVVRAIGGRPLAPDFDGHANCFIETGHGKAMLIDFNYTTEPLPGKFPLPGIGPFTLLGESEVNHWGKLAFKWIYWNLLLAGRELPLEHRMTMAGKQVA
ncbi:MAG: NAD(P)/FAD-dependent oxidoreductase [Myxococcales bacterium]|nr:NAD(P)/FAD-dependent oxidoreductase [Myxococcales bacterium]